MHPRRLYVSRALCLFVALAGVSCTLFRSPARGLEAPPVEAQVLFERARTELGAGTGAARTNAAREQLERALEVAPAWIAPRRTLDDLARGDLGGSDALEVHRQQLVERQSSAEQLYLAGRLEGAAGARRLAMAAAVDPRLAWPHHGVGVDRELTGGAAAALPAAERAFARAAGLYELSLFAQRFADLQAVVGDERGAAATLERAWERAQALAGCGFGSEAELDLNTAPSALGLRFALARAALAVRGDAVHQNRGVERVLELLRHAGGPLRDLVDLARDLPREPLGRSAAWMRHALAEAVAERADLQLAHDEPGHFALVSLGGAARAAAPETWATNSSVEQRRIEFERGAFAAAIAGWLERLPDAARGAGGLPIDPDLARLATLAAGLSESPTGPELLSLASGVARAGWIPETLAVTRAAGERELDPAQRTELAQIARYASTWDSLLAEIDLAIGALQSGAPSLLISPLEEERAALASRPTDLQELFERVERAVEAHRPGLEAWEGAAPCPEVGTISASPLQPFGPFATIAVPGPLFHDREAELELGRAGEFVPGLAQLLSGVQRVGMFGKATGRPLDGTVLRLLHAGEVAGEHLGIAFAGSLLLCEGTDADGSLARLGGGVSGAALHEGYWIDIEAERRRLARIEALHAGFEELVAPELERRLDWRGPAVDPAAPGEAALRLARAALRPALDGGDRVRLVLWNERRATGAGPLTLDDLLEVVFVHEEGHLTDRTRLLPLGENLGGVLGVALDARLSPARLEEELEYRAELVALAAVSEPRMALAEILDAARVDERRRGVHGLAYTRLLADVLSELDASLAADPERFPELNGQRYLQHQLHRLSGETVRALAEQLARKRGMAADGF